MLNSAFVFLTCLPGLALADESLPFSYTVETFCHEDEPEVRAFVVKLEQPFLAEEFEKSNYLRLKANDDRAFLVYPRATRFEQKHAEFYGRLRGEGDAQLTLSYETISENPDGSRKVVSREANLKIAIPTEPAGAVSTYRTWAQYQNRHFADLLQYYPNESFFEYLLLQSKERYGVTPPELSRLMPNKQASEEGLYKLFSSGLELQQSLQRSSLRSGSKQGDLSIHISQVKQPKIDSQDYKRLLEKRTEDGFETAVHEVSHLIPADQYLIHFNSLTAVRNIRKSMSEWGEPLLRLFREDARNHQLLSKYESQLQISLDSLDPLIASGAVTTLTVTGSDFFVAEGTDVTVLLKTDGQGAAAKALRDHVSETAAQLASLEDRTFNYRGMQIQAVYTPDRQVSSFSVQHDNWLIISNSHVGIRRIVDTLQDRIESLSEAVDYQYASTLLPATDAAEDGYVFLSDAFLRYLFSPEFKVGERRRKQSLNNLVMLNNASLFHRLEYGRSPDSLTDLIEGRFISRNAIVCPQGGAYAFDAEDDTSTSSVFNRIKYLTPIRELKVLKISAQEKSEYDRYQSRLASFWKNYFTPVAIRLSTSKGFAADYCLMPFANNRDWRSMKMLLAEKASTLQLSGVAESVFATTNLMAGRQRLGDLLKSLPGVDGVLRDDPTLTDLAWLGDRASVNFCDAHTVLEVDPTRIRQLSFPMPLGFTQQAAIATALFSAAAPMYIGIDVEDAEKANRFMEMLSSRVFLHQQDFGEFGAEIDAYQLPPYRDHAIYVVSYRIYAARIRFYAAVVGNQLLAATEPYVLNEAIDAATGDNPPREVSGQLALRVNTSAMKKLKSDLRTYWEERSRKASHRNIMPIYTLIHLYGASVAEVARISDAKYGVTYFCPDGEYEYDVARDRVYSTAYGNREFALQKVEDAGSSSFEKAFSRLKEVLLSADMSEECLSGRIEVLSE
ncbi:MAG: hypothetical protein NXI04_20670 [Planctomycetaceae bacterium]|nr:hypothetical protein [Planctomycetaceae bacterium]